MKINKKALEGRKVKVKNKDGDEVEVFIKPVMMTQLDVPAGAKTNNAILNCAVFEKGVQSWDLEDECDAETKEIYFNFDNDFGINTVIEIYKLNEEVLNSEKN